MAMRRDYTTRLSSITITLGQKVDEQCASYNC